MVNFNQIADTSKNTDYQKVRLATFYTIIANFDTDLQRIEDLASLLYKYNAMNLTDDEFQNLLICELNYNFPEYLVKVEY